MRSQFQHDGGPITSGLGWGCVWREGRWERGRERESDPTGSAEVVAAVAAAVIHDFDAATFRAPRVIMCGGAAEKIFPRFVCIASASLPCGGNRPAHNLFYRTDILCSAGYYKFHDPLERPSDLEIKNMMWCTI